MIGERFAPTMQTIHEEPEFQFPDLALGQVVSGIVRLQQEISTLRLQKANLQEKLRKESDKHCDDHIAWKNFENGYEKTVRELEERVRELDHSNKVRELKINELLDRVSNFQKQLPDLAKRAETMQSELAEIETRYKALLAKERNDKRMMQEDLKKQVALWKDVADKRLEEGIQQDKEYQSEFNRLKKELRNAKKGTPKKETRKVGKDKGTKVPTENP